MQKVTAVLIAAIISISMVVSLAASAETTTSSNASLIAVLTQLVQLLEQELQQLIAAQGGSTTPTTQPTGSPTPGGYIGINCLPGYIVSPSNPGQCVPNNNAVSLSATPTSGNAPLSIQFSGTTPQPFTNYTINFGDGTSGSVYALSDPGTAGGIISSSHTYTTPGTYTEKLFQQTNICGGAVQLAGCVSQLQVGSVTITVTPASQPNPTFSASPTSGAAPLTVTFNTSVGVGGPAYYVSFGDGTNGQSSAINTPCSQSNCQFMLTHSYASAGTYTATLYQCPGISCSQKFSGTALGTVIITVTSNGPTVPPPQPPNASVNFTATPTSGSTPLTVVFTVPTAVGYSLDFGDETPIHSIVSFTCANTNIVCTTTISHIYTSPGTYKVHLLRQDTVQGADTVLNTVTITVIGTNPARPSATIDQGSLTTTSGSPTITGTALGLSQVAVDVTYLSSGYAGYTVVPVINGEWSVTLSPSLFSSLGGYVNGALPNGSYQVSVFPGNFTNLTPSNALATDMLSVQ